MCKKENTIAIQSTLRPSQIKKVKRIAKRFDNNFSLALRIIIDSYEEDKITPPQTQ